MPDCRSGTKAWRTTISIRKSARDTSLRARLREATASAHDILDDAFDPADFGHGRNYIDFLSFQLAARRPVEAWLGAHCPVAIRPPRTVPLIERDLRALDVAAATQSLQCNLDDDSDPLGVAWVLAGSSMGNRAMLAAMAKSGVSDLPVAFLSDPDMPRFWQEMRPLLERPANEAEAAPAVASANAVFTMFAKGLELVQRSAA